METKTDINVLLEGIRCHQDDIPSLKQALLTLASMCTSNDTVQNFLREYDGLALVSRQLTNTTHTEIKEAALYTLACAVDKNVYSQKQLTSSGLFNFLYPVIKSRESTYKLRQTACFLLLNLVANNGHGQMLLRKSNCLALLFELFKTTLPNSARNLECPNDVDWFYNVTPKQRIDLWTTVTSVLCVAVNNPQNDENQRLCASIFPYAFVLMENHPVIEIVQPITSLTGLAVANNVHNQQRVLRCGGLETVVNSMHRAINRLKDGNTYLRLALCLTHTLDAVMADNESAAKKCGELGVIPLLLKELTNECIDADLKLNAIITLGHCVELCATNQKELVDLGGIPFLIRSLGSTDENEELSQAVKYVLQTCTSGELSLHKEKLSSKAKCEAVQKLLEEETDPQTDIKVLEKKFEELESKLTVRDTSRGLTLRELVACRMPDEVPETQMGDSLRIQLVKEKALRQRFELEALSAKTELRREKEAKSTKQIQSLKDVNQPMRINSAEETPSSEIWAYSRSKSSSRKISVSNGRDDEMVNSDFSDNESESIESASMMKQVPFQIYNQKFNKTESEFLKPIGPVPRVTCASIKLKTLRRNRYTPKQRTIKVRNSRCSSPGTSMVSEFDAHLLKSAVPEKLDFITDEASILTIDNITGAESESSDDECSTTFSGLTMRDSGGGDAVKNSRCPGCQPPNRAGGKLLTSRNYNIAIENDCYTCEEHRRYRHLERKLMKTFHQDNLKNSKPMERVLDRTDLDSPQRTDVYSFPSTSENVTPMTHTSSDLISVLTTQTSKSRRIKIPFTKEEEENVFHGVNSIGKFWTQILNTYSFHPSRTSVDLKDKYRNLKQPRGKIEGTPRKTRREIQPFSLAEERRLRRGVRHLNKNWSAILRAYKFQRGRTSVDLKDKWRNINRVLSRD